MRTSARRPLAERAQRRTLHKMPSALLHLRLGYCEPPAALALHSGRPLGCRSRPYHRLYPPRSTRTRWLPPFGLRQRRASPPLRLLRGANRPPRQRAREEASSLADGTAGLAQEGLFCEDAAATAAGSASARECTESRHRQPVDWTRRAPLRTQRRGMRAHASKVRRREARSEEEEEEEEGEDRESSRFAYRSTGEQSKTSTLRRGCTRGRRSARRTPCARSVRVRPTLRASSVARCTSSAFSG